MKYYFIIVVIILTAINCNSPEIDTKKEGETLMRTSREWSSVAASENVEKTLEYWADDAILVPAGEPALKGKAQIRQMIEGSFKHPSFRISWEPKTVEISKSGDLGYLMEETTMTMNDSSGNPFTKKFNAVTIWKKQPNGSWKNVVDFQYPQ